MKGEVDFSTFGSAIWVQLFYGGPEAWTQDTADLSSGTWRALAELESIENIIATDYSDQLTGDAAANTFHVRDGNDIVDGGMGDDTVILSGQASDYTIQDLGNGDYNITHNTSGDIKQLTSIEFIDYDNVF